MKKIDSVLMRITEIKPLLQKMKKMNGQSFVTFGDKAQIKRTLLDIRKMSIGIPKEIDEESRRLYQKYCENCKHNVWEDKKICETCIGHSNFEKAE